MPPKTFYDLGPRGIVINDQKQASDPPRFLFALEQDWRQNKISSPSKELTALATDKRVPMALLNDNRVFVNLNALVKLDKGQSSPGTSTDTKGNDRDRIL